MQFPQWDPITLFHDIKKFLQIKPNFLHSFACQQDPLFMNNDYYRNYFRCNKDGATHSTICGWRIFFK